MRSRCEYLTARCPYGCEVWLHPRAVSPHRDRCPGHRWTDNRLPVTQTLLDDEHADLARQICPPETLQRPNFSGDRLLNPRPGMYLRDRLVAGVVVESPLEGVTGRRWWTVLRAAHDEGWSADLAFELASFHRLEQQLGLDGHFVNCDICGDDITPKRMKYHQETNSVCRFLADTAEVRPSGSSASATRTSCSRTASPSPGPSSTAASPGATASTWSGSASGPQCSSLRLRRSRHP